MEVIASVGEETKKKKKVGGKSFLPSFWDDADASTLKAHEALSVDDLTKLSSEVMLSHIQRLVQLYVNNVDCFFFFVLFSPREILCVGFGGIFVRFWEASKLGEKGVYS